MGIQGLQTYISSLPKSYKTVNIIDEMKAFKSQTNRDPLIVINLWTLANQIAIGMKNKRIGCRLNLVKSKFESFLKKLRLNGAELLFVFKKNRTKENDFTVNASYEYKLGCEILDVMETLKSTEKIINHFERDGHFDRYPVNQSIVMVIAQTAKKYGKLFGMDSVDCKPSTIHVQIANRYKAMAMIGTDTYYIFYEGDWKFWSDAYLDMDNMTIREYDKSVILKSLGITFDQCPLFVTLAGGLYTSKDNIKKLYNFFKPRRISQSLLQNVSAYVKQQSFPITDQKLNKIVAEIYSKYDPSIAADFQRTMDLMDVTIEMKFDSEIDGRILEISDNEFFHFGNQILMNTAINISPVFLDLRINDMMPLHDLATSWIQRTAGVLLKHQSDVEPRTLIIQQGHVEGVSEIKIDPIFPDFDVPSLHDLFRGKTLSSQALDLLKWICNLKASKEILGAIPQQELCNLIILAQLKKCRSLKMFEVLSILQTIKDVESGKVPEDLENPPTIDCRAYRVSFLFSKNFFILHSCLGSVGLKQFQTDFLFDDLYFQKIYERNRNMEELSCLDNFMEVIL